MTNFEDIRQQARDSIDAELAGLTNQQRLQWLHKESLANTAEMRAMAEENLKDPKYANRIKDHAKIVLLFVEMQEELDRLHGKWMANPALGLVEEEHPELIERHQRMQQLRDMSWDALVADGYMETEDN